MQAPGRIREDGMENSSGSVTAIFPRRMPTAVWLSWLPGYAPNRNAAEHSPPRSDTAIKIVNRVLGFTEECFSGTDEQILGEAFDWSAPAMVGISLESLRATGWAGLNLPSADEYAPTPRTASRPSRARLSSAHRSRGGGPCSRYATVRAASLAGASHAECVAPERCLQGHHRPRRS
jgi:hypothetical protein